MDSCALPAPPATFSHTLKVPKCFRATNLLPAQGSRFNDIKKLKMI